MELLLSINGKRIAVRRCNNVPAERVAIISHGRFLPLQSFFTGTLDIPVPANVLVNWYVRHGETITNRTIMATFERLHRGDKLTSVKNYSGRKKIKNYALRADPLLSKSCVTRQGGHCDLILPIDAITTGDIMQAIQRDLLPYKDVHFLSCRAIRLTHTGI